MIVCLRLALEIVMVVLFARTFYRFIQTKKTAMKEQLRVWKCRHTLVRTAS